MTAPHRAQTIQVKVNGLCFEGFAEGDSANELVLFLHGFPDFADSWLPILHTVAAGGYYAVAINQRGYSLQARPDRIEDYATENLYQTFSDLRTEIKIVSVPTVFLQGLEDHAIGQLAASNTAFYVTRPYHLNVWLATRIGFLTKRPRVFPLA